MNDNDRREMLEKKSQPTPLSTAPKPEDKHSEPVKKPEVHEDKEPEQIKDTAPRPSPFKDPNDPFS